MRLPLGVLLAAIASTSFALEARAQSLPAPARPTSNLTPEPTGTVTGHVFCADTNRPTRFARVSLQPVVDLSKSAAAKALNLAEDAPAAPVTTTSVETTLDGSFTLTHVAPGAYRVIVEKEGYLNQRAMFTSKEMEDPSPDTQALIDRALPRIQVGPNQPANAEVRLERGAAVSGTVLFDDGSPAAEVSVKLLHKDPAGKWTALSGYGRKFGQGINTNDRGEFRMASLLPDQYMLQADLSLNDIKSTSSGSGERQMNFVMQNSRFSLPFYGHGDTRQADAASFTLKSGEELRGQDMTLPISKLHRLTGRVTAGADAHTVNAGSVTLLNRDDHTQVAASSIAREDGLFHFEFVPPGDYLLRVTNARDVVWERPAATLSDRPIFPGPQSDEERTLQAYGSAEQPLLFRGDLLGTTINVPPDTKPDPTPGSTPKSTRPRTTSDTERHPAP